MFAKKEKDQNWFDNNYLKTVRRITEGFDNKKMSLVGSLKIENFPELQGIVLGKSELSNLEIINCPELIEIDLTKFSSWLTTLKINNCPKLFSIKFSSDYYSSAEATSLLIINCSELIELDCSHKKLFNLKLTNCPKLANLKCSYNSIKNLNLNTCPELIKVDCSSDQLYNLEVSNCSKLVEINCRYNELTSITVSGENVKVESYDIEIIYVKNSKMEELELPEPSIFQETEPSIFQELKNLFEPLREELVDKINIMINIIKDRNKKLEERVIALESENKTLKEIKRIGSDEINKLLVKLTSKESELKNVESFLETKRKEIEDSFEATENGHGKSLLKLDRDGEENKKELEEEETASVKKEIEDYKRYEKEIEDVKKLIENLKTQIEVPMTK